MVRLLLWPVLIPALIFAAYMGWCWFQVKRFMDGLTEQIAPYAALTYEGIDLGLKGDYGVKGVRLYPIGSGIPVSIDKVQLLTEDWQSFILLGTPVERAELPHHATLSLLNIQIDSGQVLSSNPFTAAMMSQPLLQGCQNSQGEPLLISDLELGPMTWDMKLSYKFDPVSQFVNAKADILIAQLAALQVQFDLDVNGDHFSKQAFGLNPPQLVGASFGYQDQGYNRKLVATCADAAKQSAEAFLASQQQLIQQTLDTMGAGADTILATRLGELLQPGTSIDMSVELPQPLSFGPSAPSVDPAEVMNSLDLKMAINGKALANPERLFAVNQQRQLSSQQLSSAGDSVKSGAVAEAMVEKSPVPLPDKVQSESVTQISQAEPIPESPLRAEEAAVAQGFEEIAVSRLSNAHLGSRVRIDTLNGNWVEGEIIRVTRDRLLVRLKIGNGVAESPVLYRNISKLEIWQ